ncbi:hypothetical protein SSCG_02209 [Streptomyces clavuligerus]|nr:hypothetical protein SSCG_02209 [Streptomyces clavuligerus]
MLRLALRLTGVPSATGSLGPAQEGEAGMTPLFERLDREELLVCGALAVLREKVAVAEGRLAHLTITRVSTWP